MAHEIRLAGPWEYSTDGTQWARCVLPFPGKADVAAIEGTKFLLRRKFHRPSGLTESARVSMVVSGQIAPPTARVNTVPLAASATASDDETEFGCTEHLQDFNTFEVTVVANADSQPQLVAAVKLRIVDEGEDVASQQVLDAV